MSTTKKKAAPKKRATVSAKKMCSKVIKREGVKADGTLKKGYKYVKGGRIVKVTVKPVAKKKAVAKKKTSLNASWSKGPIDKTYQGVKYTFKKDRIRGFEVSDGSRRWFQSTTSVREAKRRSGRGLSGGQSSYSGKEELINNKWYPVTVKASSVAEAVKKLYVGQRKSYGTVTKIRGRFSKDD